MARQVAYDYLFKLLIVGDSGVGKTGLLLRFSHDCWSRSLVITLGIDFKTKTVEINSSRVKLQIWDSAGCERFRTITTAYYHSTMGILLVYDITDEQSFLNIPNWIRNIKQHVSDSVQIILIGNKCDMSDDRIITKDRGQELADEYGIQFFETSAKTDINVTEAFIAIATDIFDEKMSMSDGGTTLRRKWTEKEQKWTEKRRHRISRYISTLVLCSGLMEFALILLFILYFQNENIQKWLYLPLIFAVPLSLPICFWRYSQNTALVNASEFALWSLTSKTNEEFYDKIYCIINANKHGEEFGKNQYDFYTLDLYEKIEYIKSKCTHYEPMWYRLLKHCSLYKPKNKQHVFNVVGIFYIIFRIYMILFPFIRIFYQHTSCKLMNKTECMLQILITVILGLYFIILILFGVSFVHILRYEYCFGYLQNLQPTEYIQFWAELVVNKMIYECVHHDIAQIICSYLTNPSIIHLNKYHL